MFNIILNSSVSLKQFQEISELLEIEETTDCTKPVFKSLHHTILSDSEHGYYRFDYYFDNEGNIVSIIIELLE